MDADSFVAGQRLLVKGNLEEGEATKIAQKLRVLGAEVEVKATASFSMPAQSQPGGARRRRAARSTARAPDFDEHAAAAKNLCPATMARLQSPDDARFQGPAID